MRKIFILLCAIIVCIYSITNALAGGYNFEMLNYSEKKQVEKVGNRLIIALDTRGGCSSQLYTKIYNKLISADKSYYNAPKKRAIFSYLRYIIDINFSNCWEVQNDDNDVLNLLGEAENVSIKKGIFIKNIGGDVEARQNKLYTYFYRGDILINTIKNKIKGDRNLIFGKNYNGWWNDEEYLTTYYAKKKLSLYGAYSYYDYGVKKLYFSKLTDFGTKSYIYNIDTSSWE